ncbi:MAG: hypothetical protein J7K22_02985 [Nanoarchaeota archaeon]|nr:hypothetical protein [Nanoarchaeota archaeon]
MGKVFSDKPIAEITLRKFERPFNENKDELIRKFCISLGLLQPGDSRDVIVDILKVLLDARKEKKMLSSKEIEQRIKSMRERGVASSNIRRQLLRLQRINLVERVKDMYRIKEFLQISELLDDIYKFLIQPTFERIKEYAKEIDKL